MCRHFNNRALCLRDLVFSIITKPVEIVKLHGDNGTSFGILNLKVAIIEWKLKPVISIELRHQVPLRVNKCKLLRVSAKHALAYIELKLLFFSRLLQSVKQDVVDCTFTTTNDSFLAVLVHVNWLMLEDNLLFQLQIRFSKYKNFSFTRDIYVISRTNCAENFYRFTFCANASY